MLVFMVFVCRGAEEGGAEGGFWGAQAELSETQITGKQRSQWNWGGAVGGSLVVVQEEGEGGGTGDFPKGGRRGSAPGKRGREEKEG